MKCDEHNDRRRKRGKAVGADVVALGEPLFELNATGPGSFTNAPSFAPGFGGDTSNFAIAVARLGARSGYICGLGDDAPGRAFLSLWQAEGVDTSRVEIVSNRSTGMYFITHDEDGKHEFTYVRRGSAATGIGPEALDLDYIRNAKIFHVSGITQAIGPDPRDAVDAAVQAANSSGTLVSYDLNWRPALWSLERAREALEHTLPHVDIVFASLEEARALLDAEVPADDPVEDRAEDPADIVRALQAFGPDTVALTLGADGCIVAGGDGDAMHIPAWPIEVKDAAGAGDAFAAAFVVGHLEGWTLRRIGAFANAVGALTASGSGCVAPIPRRGDVEKLLANLPPEGRHE